MRRLHDAIFDESGQDVAEYVLLGGFLAFAAVVGVRLLSDAMSQSYTSLNDGVQSDAMVEVPNPAVVEP